MDRLAKELEKVDLAGENGEIADLNINLDGTSELDGSEQIEHLDDALSAKSEDENKRGTRLMTRFPYMVLMILYLDEAGEASPRGKFERQSSSSSIRSATSSASRESRGVSSASELRGSPASKTVDASPVEEDPIERRAREREERQRQRQK